MGQGVRESRIPPRCKAILLCDKILVEAGTGKISLVGIFDRVGVAGFPAAVGPFNAFLQMTDGVGRYEVFVEVHDLSDGLVLARTQSGMLEFKEPTDKINFQIAMPRWQARHGGAYDFVVLADDEVVERQRFEVLTMPKPKEANGGSHTGRG
jgi:hypothetical protein